MKKVSVIIPCYNLSQEVCNEKNETAFDICIQSVLNQTMNLNDIEIILVDDHSSDSGFTASALKTIESRYPDNVLLIDLPENVRAGGARNAGLSYASGEYIAMLDSDDWVEADLYNKTYSLAKEHDADMLYFYHQAVRGDLRVPMDDMDNPGGLIVINSVEERKRFLMSQAVDLRCTTKLYKKKLLDDTKVSFPEHTIYEEPGFTYPLQFYGNRFYIHPEILYNYRMNPDSMMHGGFSIEKLALHTKVQMNLYSELCERGLLDEYEDEINYNFMHSFYYETLKFADNQGIKLSKDFIEYLYSVLVDIIPNWEGNKYLKTDRVLEASIKERGIDL